MFFYNYFCFIFCWTRNVWNYITYMLYNGWLWLWRRIHPHFIWRRKHIVVSYFGYGNESLQTVTFVFLVFVVIFITFKGAMWCLVKGCDAWFLGCFWPSISRPFLYLLVLFTYSHCLWKQRLLTQILWGWDVNNYVHCF